MDTLKKIDPVMAVAYAVITIAAIVVIKKTDLAGLNSKYLGL
jgi:hypothetical protein